MKIHKKLFSVFVALLFSLILGPAMASALPSCTELATNPAYGIAGNSKVIENTITESGGWPTPVTTTTKTPVAQIMPATGPTKVTNGMTPSTPAYCQVDLTYSTMGGHKNGYDEGQVQKIWIRVLLPLNSVDGGSGRVQGSWNQRVMVSGGSGWSGSVVWSGFTEGVTRDNATYAIRLGYAGGSSDTGQHNPPFGVITSGRYAGTLATGTLLDFKHRGTKYARDWTVALAKAYYGMDPARVYYNGCSGGGNQGMGQLMNYGDEYDGFLIGAPAFHFQQFGISNAWPGLVQRALTQTGIPFTQGQINAANAAAMSACDSLDGVADSIMADPRACTFSATANICGRSGAPASPNCLDADQAAAIDRIWAGPHNHRGKRIYYPKDMGINFGTGTGAGMAGQHIQFNHKDTSFDTSFLYLDDASLKAAGNPAGGITYENEILLGSKTTDAYMNNRDPNLYKARKHGTKVIHTHGTQDGVITWRHSADYYRQVAVRFGKAGKPDYDSLQDWYRFYAMPGVDHCGGGGVGPSPNDPFFALEDWVERGIAPDRIKAEGGTGAPSTGRSRPLCPYPKWAIYTGRGSTDNWENFGCGGDLEANTVSLCKMPRLKERYETMGLMNTSDTGISESLCKAYQED